MAVPVVIGAEELFKYLIGLGCTYIACSSVNKTVSYISASTTKTVDISISKEQSKTKQPSYVHKSNSEIFALNLIKNGSTEINRNLLSKGDNRFGGQFYVASDKLTADLERPGIGTYIKLEFTEGARILDLTDPGIAKKYGYKTGLTHEQCRNLMRNWDLYNYDAIKYPSERGGNYNFAVMNFSIIKPVGIE